MAKTAKQARTKARRVRGFRDIVAGDVAARDQMIQSIRQVYERYGYDPLETPALEYVDALGKFLPEADRPDAGIYALRDENDEWIALRYDLTAPLARYVAMNPELPRPFRRYQVGPVYRVEKPGPDRFREFYQFDFDSVGTNSMVADAECCLVVCDALEAIGIARGDYVLKVNNRKVLNGVLERAWDGATVAPATATRVLRCVDKLDKVGLDGVRQLLGKGRKDESGAFIPGVEIDAPRIDALMSYLSITGDRRSDVCDALEREVGDSAVGLEGVKELREIEQILTASGVGVDRVRFDPTVVRGLEYYTGPVFEAVLTFEVVDAKGIRRQFGSVFGGGRYDNLVQRFTGQQVPATGGSIGVDRLLAALSALGKVKPYAPAASVLVTRLDKNLTQLYVQLAQDLRAANIATELYVGNQGIGKQFKYASDTGKTIALIVGSDEAERNEVSVKDLRLGEEVSREIGADRKKWLEEQPAQFTTSRDKLVGAILDVLARYGTR